MSERDFLAAERAAHQRQAINLLVGELLGEGATRRVYSLTHSPDLVLKVDEGGSMDNVREWLVWHDLEHSEWAKWLAPCVSIDEQAGVMLQRRACPLTDEQWRSLTAVPQFLGDLGRRNWGWLDGRPVMVDYGYNHLTHRGLKRMGMVPLDHAREGT